MQEYEVNENIESMIIEERNREIIELETDLIDMSEIFFDLGNMIHIQGENMDIMNNLIETTNRDVSISLKNLADAEDIINIKYQTIRNISIVIGGITLGACGFIVGPLIGLGTLISGAGIGTGIVYASKNK